MSGVPPVELLLVFDISGRKGSFKAVCVVYNYYKFVMITILVQNLIYY